MKDYLLITDSTCDISPDMYEKNGIERFIMNFTINGTDYPDDGVTLAGKAFYDTMRGGAMPVTAQINPDTFSRRFTEAVERGLDVVYLCFASATSGTFQSANLARRMVLEAHPEAVIHVIDSCSQCGGEGRLAIAAAQKKREGLSADELSDWLEKNKLRFIHLFTVADLDHLHRGGRLSKTAAIAGKALGIKPVMYTAPDGKLTVGAKVRGRKAALRTMVDKMELVIEHPEEQDIIINHADCPEDAAWLCAAVKERVPAGSVTILPMGPIIGAHVGPGCIALFFTGRTREWQK